MGVAEDQALAKAVIESLSNPRIDFAVIATTLGGSLNKGAVSMRWTRLQKKLATPGSALTTEDHALVKAVIQYLGVPTLDYAAISAKLGGGLNKGAVSMRWSRLQKKWGIQKSSAGSSTATPKKGASAVKKTFDSGKKGSLKRKLVSSDEDSGQVDEKLVTWEDADKEEPRDDLPSAQKKVKIEEAIDYGYGTADDELTPSKAGVAIKRDTTLTPIGHSMINTSCQRGSPGDAGQGTLLGYGRPAISSKTPNTGAHGFGVTGLNVEVTGGYGFAQGWSSDYLGGDEQLDNGDGDDEDEEEA